MTTERKEPKSVAYGIGCDIGTMNLISARRTIKGVETKRMRDVFIDFPLNAKKTLRMSNVNFVERGDEILILGDAALEMANVFGKEARRPLSGGLVSPSEIDSLEVLGLLLENILGKPVVENEVCCFSVPANPIDQPGKDIIYHTGVFERIVRECGYRPIPSNEAMAIIFAETAPENFSGIGLSFGAGMVNTALAINTIEGLSFSLARCLAEGFPISLADGRICPVEKMKPGDLIIGADGLLAPVVSVLDTGTREKMVRLNVSGFSGFDLMVTPEHRIFVKRGLVWNWVEASQLIPGDIVGTPVVKSQLKHKSYYFGRQNKKNITGWQSRALGRFFGIFLGDGSCGPTKDRPQFVQIAFNRKDSKKVAKYVAVMEDLFGRTPQIGNDPHENVTRMKLHITPVARHMRDHFYTSDGSKYCSLTLDKMSSSTALGIIEGLLDSDGFVKGENYVFENTSPHIINCMHLLLDRFGIRHTLHSRKPRRGGVNSKGVQIEGRKKIYCIQTSGKLYRAMLDVLLTSSDRSLDRIMGYTPDFAEHTIEKVDDVSYGGRVFDLVVNSEHRSFTSVGLVAHNCGDWIDRGAANAVGSTQARICAIKEGGMDLNATVGREQEAIAFYYKAMIEYSLDHIALKFKEIQNHFSLPKPIPIVVSGGSSLVGGFLEFFTQVFEKKRAKFPVAISDIRQAKDPMNAVAYGLLVQAIQEQEEVE